MNEECFWVWSSAILRYSLVITACKKCIYMWCYGSDEWKKSRRTISKQWLWQCEEVGGVWLQWSQVTPCVLLWLTCQGGFQVHVLFRLACQEIFLHECKPMSGESNGGFMFYEKMWMIISNDSKSEIVPGESQEISKHQPHGSIIQILINNRNCFIITGGKWEDERRTSTIMVIKFHFVS